MMLLLAGNTTAGGNFFSDPPKESFASPLGGTATCRAKGWDI